MYGQARPRRASAPSVRGRWTCVEKEGDGPADPAGAARARSGTGRHRRRRESGGSPPPSAARGEGSGGPLAPPACSTRKGRAHPRAPVRGDVQRRRRPGRRPADAWGRSPPPGCARASSCVALTAERAVLTLPSELPAEGAELRATATAVSVERLPRARPPVVASADRGALSARGELHDSGVAPPGGGRAHVSAGGGAGGARAASTSRPGRPEPALRIEPAPAPRAM